MPISSQWKFMLLCAAAGGVNGILGTGGGLILIVFLPHCCKLKEDELMPTSITIMFFISAATLVTSAYQEALSEPSLPFLLAGSLLGGTAAGKLRKRIPIVWLHRALGAMLIIGGLKSLWH